MTAAGADSPSILTEQPANYNWDSGSRFQLVKSVAAGAFHTCASKADDTVACWGQDDYGQSTVPAEFQ